MVVGSRSVVLDAPVAVYNLEVEGAHTYFVEDCRGEQIPLWVHNRCAFDLHHPWPRYLGGAANQPTTRMRSKTHRALHAALDSWMDGKYARWRGAGYYAAMNKREIIEDLTEFYKTADGGRYRKYLHDFRRAVMESGV